MRFESGDELQGAEFVAVDLSRARFKNVDFTDVRIVDSSFVNSRISGWIDGLVINNVEIAPLIHAELNRRFPERALLFPGDADGVRAAWSVIQRLWVATKQRITAVSEATPTNGSPASGRCSRPCAT